MVTPPKENKPYNAIIEKSFTDIINNRFENSRAVYKYYHKELDKNIYRLQNHLDICKSYQDTMKSSRTPGALRAPANWSQQQITTAICSSLQKRAEHWARMAKAVYMTNLPFIHYENKYIVAHLHGLDSSHKPPSYNTPVGHLLDQYYEKTKNKVDAQLCAPRFLNFYTDESNNICKNRVINFLTHTPKSCGTKRGCFYIYSKYNGARTIDAKIPALGLHCK